MVDRFGMAAQGPSPTDAVIGATIRARRDEIRMTQAQLARAVGVTFQQVQKYERGANRVSASALLRMSEVMDCHVADLYGSEVNDAQATTTSEKQILRLWKDLRPREREAVIDMVRAFQKESGS